MNAFRKLPRQLILLGFLMTLSLTQVFAQDASQSLAERYPAGSIDTTERAKVALGDVNSMRRDLDQFYSKLRVACFDRFFATSCMNDVREKRHAAMSKIRKVEVEANAFLRKEKADERDRALAERDVRAKQQSERSLPITSKTREQAADGSATEVPAAPEVHTAPKAPVNGQP